MLAKKTLRFVQFNVENLFIYLDLYKGQDLKKINEKEWQSYSSSTTPNKPIRKLWSLAHIIQTLKPDILMLNEIGGKESIENFNRYFLEDQYSAQLIEGNSRRGIDVGYLMRKDLPYKPLLISHKDRPLHFLYPHENQTPAGGKTHYFSRDVAELRLFQLGQTTPEFIILLTHLKSKLDSEKIDPSGRLRRAAELKCLIEIYNEVKREVSPETGLIVSGDFNGIANGQNKEIEFQPLHEQSDLVDVFDVAALPEQNRFTQIQITHSGQIQFIQLDYIFISPNLKSRIKTDETFVHYFQDQHGSKLNWPKNLEERSLLASDHYPVVTTINLTP